MENLTILCSTLFLPAFPQAPFTPFITELMYQNLRHLIDPASVEEKDSGSIHYLMLPQVRLAKVLSHAHNGGKSLLLVSLSSVRHSGGIHCCSLCAF